MGEHRKLAEHFRLGRSPSFSSQNAQKPLPHPHPHMDVGLGSYASPEWVAECVADFSYVVKPPRVENSSSQESGSALEL